MKITEKINWKRFEDKYIRLETDVEKKLKLMKWQGGVWFGKPGIRCDVVEEDGRPVQKQFTITSQRLIRALRPIILQAEQQKRNAIGVSIIRSGEEFATKYAVRVLQK